jgi:hypothetical protein
MNGTQFQGESSRLYQMPELNFSVIADGEAVEILRASTSRVSSSSPKATQEGCNCVQTIVLLDAYLE